MNFNTKILGLEIDLYKLYCNALEFNGSLFSISYFDFNSFARLAS